MEEFIKNNIGWLSLGTVGLSSILLVGWRYIKGFFLNTWHKLFLNVVIGQSYSSNDAVLTYLFLNYKKFQFGKIYLETQIITINEEHRLCIGEQLRDFIIFYKKFRFIIYSKSRDENGNIKSSGSIMTIRIGFDLKKFILDSYNFYLNFKKLNNSYNFFNVQGELFDRDKEEPRAIPTDNEDISNDLFWIIKSNTYNITMEELLNIKDNPMEGIFLNRNAQEIINKIDTWYDTKNFYQERRIPWKLSFLLHGKGGTGKTSFVTKVAKKYKMNLYRFDLSTFNNRSFVKKWESVITDCNSSPGIILFEDFDNIFQGRENVSSKTKSSFEDGLTFDCLLNCLSGVIPNDGVLLFITTNKIDTIDEAIGVFDVKTGMSTRPGRIDYVYEFASMEDEPRKEMIYYILHDLGIDLDKVFEDTAGMTGVQVQKYCIDMGSEKLKRGIENGIK